MASQSNFILKDSRFKMIVLIKYDGVFLAMTIDDYRKQTLLQQHSAWAQKRNSLGPKSTGGLVRNTS